MYREKGKRYGGDCGESSNDLLEKVIRRAFQELLLEKEYRKITIKEIAERADINRGTFYKYYKDTAALLEIEGELVEQIASNLQQENLSLDLWLEKLLTILYENPSTTHLILLNNSHLLNLLLSEIKPETLKRFAQYFQDASEEELELCLSFCLRVYRVDRTLAQRFLNDVAKSCR